MDGDDVGIATCKVTVYDSEPEKIQGGKALSSENDVSSGTIAQDEADKSTDSTASSRSVEGNSAESVTSAAKKKQTIKAKLTTKTIKASKLKKKKQTIKNAITVINGYGAITYSRVSSGSSKALTINKKGVITVKKKTKKGTYKLKVKITAAGDGTYKSATKTVTVKVNVK